MLWLQDSVQVGVVVEDGHFLNGLENRGKDSGFCFDMGGNRRRLNRRMIASYLDFKRIVLTNLWRINL